MAGKELCEDHPEEILRFVCVPCDVLVCRDCKLTEHEGHRSVDISKATAGFREKFKLHQSRLQQRLAVLDNVAREVAEDQQTAREARHVIEQEIQRRVNMATEWIQKYGKAALEELETTVGQIETHLSTTIKNLKERQDTVNSLLEDAQFVTSDLDSNSNLKHVATFRFEKDMRCGRGTGENLERLTENLPSFSVRPVLHGNVNLIKEDSVRRFVGKPILGQISKTNPTVALSTAFRWRTNAGPSSDVHAVCPLPDGNIWVAYDIGNDARGEDLRVALYDQEGTLLRDEKVPERVSIVHVEKDWVFASGIQVRKLLSPRESREIITEKEDPGPDRSLYLNVYPRQANPTEALDILSKGTLRYALQASPKGANYAICEIETRGSLPLLWITRTTSFTISAERPRALDADSGGLFFAIIEAGPSVKVYRLSKSVAVGTYSPSKEEFSPSDVCFFSMKGKEILLVADCYNNAIHILDYHDGLRFLGYFGAGCQILQEPMTLARDYDNRLWIGCREGSLLTCVLDMESQFVIVNTKMREECTKL